MDCKTDNKMRIVYSYYVLDIVHRGHLLYMRNAKKIAGENGISVVGILTDKAVMKKKPKPILSFNERVELARAIKCNDIIVAQETYSPLPNLKNIKPDITLESTSHKAEDIKKVKRYMQSINGKVIVMPYYPSQSSTKIKRKIKE